MVHHHLGNGVPSSVTPKRVKKILNFVRSQERSFKEALEKMGGSTSEKVLDGSDLYDQIHSLIRTESGRRTYQKAKNRFESEKPKRAGRADFFNRLKQDCLTAIPEQTPTALSENLDAEKEESDPQYLTFAKNKQWQQMAEYIWAQCASKNSGNDIIATTTKYPQLVQYLSSIQVYADSQNNDMKEIDDQISEEKTGEVGEIIELVVEAAQELKPHALDSDTLAKIISNVNRLTEISNLRSARKRYDQECRERITTLRTTNFEIINNNQELSAYLASLESTITSTKPSKRNIDLVLKNLERYIAVHKKFEKAKILGQQAYENENWDAASRIAVELKNYKSEKKALLANVDAELKKANSQSSRKQLHTSVNYDTKRAIESDSRKTSDKSADLESTTHEKNHSYERKQNAHDSSDAKNRHILANQDSESIKLVPPVQMTTNREDWSDSEVSKRVLTVLGKEINDGRYSIAYHVAKAASGIGLTPSIVELIASNYATRDFYSVVSDLPSLAAKVNGNLKEDIERSVDQMLSPGLAALVASSALTLARYSTGGPVSQLLLFCESYLKNQVSLWKIVQAAANVSLAGIPLHTALILEGDAQEKWKLQVNKLDARTEEWLEVARLTSFRYKPATDVWRRILDNREIGSGISLGNILEKLRSIPTSIHRNANNILTQKMNHAIDSWHRNSDREIDNIDRECRAVTKFKSIDGPARIDLRSKVSELLGLMDCWLNLHRLRPLTSASFFVKQIDELKVTVNRYQQMAEQEISKLDGLYEGRTLELFKAYCVFFGESDKTMQPDMALMDLLTGELLADVEIEFCSDNGMPKDDVSLEKLFALSNLRSLNFSNAAVQRALKGDFVGARRASDFAFRAGYLLEHEADEVERKINQQRAVSQKELKSRIQLVNDQLGASYARGVVSTSEFEAIQAQIPPHDVTIEDYLQEAFTKIDRVEQQLMERESERCLQLQGRRDDLDSMAPEHKRRIDDALSEGRFLVAEDFLDCIARGEPLPPQNLPQPRALDDFFPGYVQQYDEFRCSVNSPVSEIRKALEEQSELSPVDGVKLFHGTAHDELSLADAWANLQPGRYERSDLELLFRSLGFFDPIVKNVRSLGSEGELFRVYTDTDLGRNVVQLPELGSRAGGRYRVFCVPRNVSDVALVQRVKALMHDDLSPVFIVSLDFLPVDRRRFFASQFAQGLCGSPLLLDEGLAMYLAQKPINVRLSALFDCVSAFTFSSPFNPDAVQVPPEMFFGRVNARKRILSTEDASHLIFGGRRLGKTALLKSIQQEFSKKSENEVVVYLDLKSAGFQLEDVDKIWTRLADELSSKILSLRKSTRGDLVRKRIKSWILERPSRRILLLLDEADDFLQFDPKQNHSYRVLAKFKELMDQTQRRFKVVFSGLHNVQRASRDPNTPLAHLGYPIQIGPMFPDQDGQSGSAVENLIRLPLEALGFRFDCPEDVTSIAMETNYYPALAQQFCKQLLNYLRDHLMVSGWDGPPYNVSTEMVKTVFDSKENRDRLREIFLWTIRLDPRYEFLTFLIAQRALSDDYARTQGVGLFEIREIALLDWPKGFAADSSFLTFEVLLEEMIGLGVLREIGVECADGELRRLQSESSAQATGTYRDRRFSIRTQSLRMLLGSNDEIERRYADSKTKLVLNFEPSKFRRTLNKFDPAPLSATQEKFLLFEQLVVGLVFGTKLSGVDLVAETLRRVASEVRNAPTVEIVDAENLIRRLKSISRRRKQDNFAVIVDIRGLWDLGLVEQTAKIVRKLHIREKHVRVIFLSDPAGAWGWLNNSELDNFAGVTATWLTPCSIDFACVWLEQREVEAFAELNDPSMVEWLPWPVVMSTAAKSRHVSLRNAFEELVTTNSTIVSDVLEIHDAEFLFKTLSEFSPMQIDELQFWLVDSSKEFDSQAAEIQSVEQLFKVVDWAMRLGVVTKSGKNYVLDNIYRCGLTRRNEV